MTGSPSRAERLRLIDQQRRDEIARRIEQRKTAEERARDERIQAARRVSSTQRDPVPLSDLLLMQRAMAAYFRTADLDGVVVPVPSGTASRVQTLQGLRYVVLRGTGGVLAAYRIRSNGPLRRLKRWPSALEAG